MGLINEVLMKKAIAVILLLCLTAMPVACTNMSKTSQGALSGAAGGALAGAGIGKLSGGHGGTGALIGGALGGVVGAIYGASEDAKDGKYPAQGYRHPE